MHRHGISKACVVAALLALVALPVRAASAPAVPADARLDPVRTQLQATVDQAAQSGLPAEALISKVQEGLAKNVAPARILQVVSALAADYAAARAYAAQLSPGGKPQAALLRALVDAKAAGIKWSDAAPLLRAASAVGAGAAGAAVPGSRIDGPTRAITVLTDLAVRGYPTDHAVAVVSAVLTSDPQALPRLPSDLERVRRAHGLTQAETLDALAAALSQSAGGLDKAVQRAEDTGDHPGQGPPADRGRGPNRDSSGNHGKK